MEAYRARHAITRDLRWYAVWTIPNTLVSDQLHGVHASPGGAAYQGIMALSGGFGVHGLRWRSFSTLREAISEYRERAPGYSVPMEANFVEW